MILQEKSTFSSLLGFCFFSYFFLSFFPFFLRVLSVNGLSEIGYNNYLLLYFNKSGSCYGDFFLSFLMLNLHSPYYY